MRAERERLAKESFRTAHLEDRRSRAISTVGPQAGEESLRAAYLGLLKLCLCDLAGASTLSVTTSDDSPALDSEVFSRELAGEELELRVNGIDWPWTGLTMIGLLRLDDLQDCVQSVVADGVDGDLIEAGAWRGGASILMRATLDSLGSHERTVWVADSFQGLPAPDTERFPQDRGLNLSGIDFLAAPLEEVKGYFARFGCERGVRFVPGLFDQTLPSLRDRRWSIVRIDGDTYESTWVALESLYPGLSAGGYLVLDDYGLIEECRQAVDDFRREHGITEPIEEIDLSGARWRRADAPRAESTPSTTRTVIASSSERTVERQRARIPTQRERELERELAALRERLRDTPAARVSPLARAARWARSKLRGRT
jgi:hypothetical protein